MLLMTASTVENRQQDAHHPLSLEFRLGNDIVNLNSTPKVGDRVVVALKPDSKTGDMLWATEYTGPQLHELMKNYLSLPAKQVVVCDVLHAEKLNKGNVWSLALSRIEDDKEFLVHYFGVDGYSVVTELKVESAITPGSVTLVAVPDSERQVVGN